MTREYYKPLPSDRNIQMLTMRLKEHKPYSLIGRYFGVSKQRVFQIVSDLRDRGLDKTLDL